MINIGMDIDINKLYDDVTQKADKKLPYPLENIDQELFEIHFMLEGIRNRIKSAKNNAFFVKNSAKMKELNLVEFKLNTILSVLSALTKDSQRLKF